MFSDHFRYNKNVPILFCLLGGSYLTALTAAKPYSVAREDGSGMMSRKKNLEGALG
jgi:hypothetical protein